jgi:hypothetical protein
MHKLSQLTLGVSSAFALALAFACSSEPEGNGNDNTNTGPQPFGQPNGMTTNPNQPSMGAAGSGNVTGAPNGEGNPNVNNVNNPTMNAGGSGGAGGMTAPVVDQMPQETPGGYFSAGPWHGYAWTGDDALGIGTTRSVQDFSMLANDSPFCLTGTVAPDPDTDGPTAPLGYRGVALLGFNIAQEQFGAMEGQTPAIGTIVPTGMGVAVNYTKAAGQVLRIQLQGATGETDENQRWCAELTAVNGPAFIPYAMFTTRCWTGGTPQTPYNREPLAAVVMTIPGDDLDPVPYNVCVAGFADGNSIADAPTQFSLPRGLLTGTLSGEAARIKVTGKDGQSYVINNNAWGDNSSDGSQQIRYVGNSFEVLRQTAGPGGSDSPASFPSIYIGQNGAVSGVNGASTSTENPLPIRISDIRTLPSTFKISGPQGAQNNAAYDIWFANSAVAPGSYNTAQAAFLMVWTHKPGSHNPIGNGNMPFATGQTVQGVAGTWDIWAGRRGGNGPDANLPVINYVAPADVPNFSADLKLFMADAVARSGSGRLNGFQFPDTLFLTDVFAGFEIWSGGTGLKVDEFTAVINP